MPTREELAQETYTTVIGRNPGSSWLPYAVSIYGSSLYNAAFNNYKNKILKKEITKPEIIGISNIAFRESSIKSDDTNLAYDALTETLDTTTYPDKAILKLYNGRGFDVYLTGLQIDGLRIVKYSGSGGGLINDSLKRDNDIRNNGENILEIANDYIVTSTQADKIADYHYKYNQNAKHVYSLTIPGVAYWYSLGEWYNLKLGQADTNENIDSVVECIAVDVERSAGGIGSTNIMFRDVSENWTKTTLYTARALTGGSPSRRVSRSNIVTVASSQYFGQYDYLCDGTDDDVQIQAAIDSLAIFGGGTVQLTEGTYNIGDTITMSENIILTGVGNATILMPHDNTVYTIINFNDTMSTISNFSIDGDGNNISFYGLDQGEFETRPDITEPVVKGGTGTLWDAGLNYGKCISINVRNYDIIQDVDATTGLYFVIFRKIYSIDNSSISGCAVTASSDITILEGITNCLIINKCSVYANTTSGIYSQINAINGESGIATVSSCSVSNNSGSGNIICFNSPNISSCSVSNNTLTGNDIAFYGYAFCSNVSSCMSYGNSVSNTQNNSFSFYECNNITVSRSFNNTNIIGFGTCKSVQQCKSDDTSKYGTGATQSYSDAGTTNACQDTAAGGYNS